MARNLSPFYIVLFDRGFSPDTVETPSRLRVRWPASESELQGVVSALGPAQGRLLQDAWKATPRIAAVAAALGTSDEQWVNAVTQMAQLVSPQRQSPVTIPPTVARDIVLALAFHQAISDADDKNYHRAHVILSDIARTMSEQSPLRERVGRDVFSRFFAEVPDKARFEDFGGRLVAYSGVREKEVLVAGEHAAVLHAAGFTAASEFMREQLLSRFDLITLPMIDKAVQRGVSFGFPAPDSLVAIQGRLKDLADTLREGERNVGIEAFRSAAVEAVPDEDYEGVLERLEKFWDAGRRKNDDEAGLEKILAELAGKKRRVMGWIREKSQVIRHEPLWTLWPPMTHRFLALMSPLTFDPDKKTFVPRSVDALIDEMPNLGQDMETWCSGGELPKQLADGSAYALLAWYWYEAGRPELARAALIGGGRALLRRAREIPAEQLVALSTGAVDPLLAELNGYRFLVAAAEIEAAPPGAVRGAGGGYLPELAVLLSSWQRLWEDCGLPAPAADRVVREIKGGVERAEAASERWTDSRERYYFGDYRFSHGFLPDIVVSRAIDKELLGPSGETPPSPEAAATFLRSFDWPHEYSRGSLERWKTAVRPR